MVLPPTVALSVPAHPSRPVEQFRVGAIAPVASAAIVPLGSVNAAWPAACWVGVSDADAGLAKSTPVGALEVLGSKQPSNSKTGLETSRPCASGIVSWPTNFDGPPAV